jgi:pimeloyl-ACP methyl ester carboxylesterase
MAALLALFVLANWPASSPGLPSPSLSFSACAGSSAGFGCASLPVPADRGASVGGTISLSVERKLAGAIPSRSAVLALAGGPGQAALPLGGFIAKAVAPALGTRDLLVFDQRGTGESNPLSCVALSAPEGSIRGNRISDCADELGPMRGGYTTSESVEDIEALRQASGYEKLVLYGTSYGTKVALDYAERYPQNVEALVLDSTETPGGPDPFRVSTFKAITLAFDELCSLGACSRITDNPVGDLATVLSRMAAGPLSGHVYDEHGKRVKLSMTSEQLYELLLQGDLNPALRADMPAALHAAAEHDSAPLLRLLALQYESETTESEGGEVDNALFFATTCEETPFPWQRGAAAATRAVEAEAALDRLPASDFYPFDREAAITDGVIPACLNWPAAAPPPPAERPLPNVPTLIFSGGQDLRTPTENALQVSTLIPDAEVLVVPFTGHSVVGSDLTSCAAQALASFFASWHASPCAASADKLPPVPVAPRSLTALAPARGTSGSSGRALSATAQTLGDLRRTIIEIGLTVNSLPVGVRFGGLRGGSAHMTKSDVILEHLTYVPGIEVSGTISANLLLKGRGATSTLKVGGSAHVSGVVRLSSAGRAEGVLAGVRFSVDLAAHALSAHTRAAQQREQAQWPAGSLYYDPFPLTPLSRLR